MATNRILPLAAVSATAAAAGAIASRNGRATALPMPFSTVRRDRWRLVMIMGCSRLMRSRLARRRLGRRPAAHPKRGAPRDAGDVGADPVVVPRGVADDRAQRRHVVRLDATTERVRHEIL